LIDDIKGLKEIPMGGGAGPEMIVIYNEVYDSLVKCGQRMNQELQTFKLIETAIESTKFKKIS
jgi:hypothetical protein